MGVLQSTTPVIACWYLGELLSRYVTVRLGSAVVRAFNAPADTWSHLLRSLCCAECRGRTLRFARVALYTEAGGGGEPGQRGWTHALHRHQREHPVGRWMHPPIHCPSHCTARSALLNVLSKAQRAPKGLLLGWRPCRCTTWRRARRYWCRRLAPRRRRARRPASDARWSTACCSVRNRSATRAAHTLGNRSPHLPRYVPQSPDLDYPTCESCSGYIALACG
jgi:hypothetical protein